MSGFDSKNNYKYLKKTIVFFMVANPGVKNPVCPNPNCGKKGITFRKDGTVRCKSCGYEGPYKERKL